MQPPQPLHAQWLMPQHTSALSKPAPMQQPPPQAPTPQQMLPMTWPHMSGADMWAKSAPLMAPKPAMAGYMAQGIPCGMSAQQEIDFHASEMAAMSTDGMTAEELVDLDPKKYKRMMSNRASAKRSRQRKQERLEELEIQSAKLRVENAAVTRRLNEATEHIRHFQESNERLHDELKRLRDALARAGVVVANPATETVGVSAGGVAEKETSAKLSLKIGQPGSKRGSGGESENVAGVSKRARPSSGTEERPTSTSAVTGSSGGPSDDEAGAAVAGKAVDGNNTQHLDTLADAEFLAGLIGCFDNGKPLASLV
eukprot:TRINITY_DN7720_c0_g1_i1.p1 TRINITY_DN7720_c0_g1~~TRINITY_DN7720_c0_g1_i1.p1  ORF type:complete len:312 (-),score=-3.47 TRINITY_DN7720_c0_g1_i1:134-1069(-)